MRRMVVLTAAMLAMAGCVGAHGSAAPAVSQPSPADVQAIEATLGSVYTVISGPAGQPRDFDRMRTLFTADARLSAITPQGVRGGTVEDYIARSGKSLVDQGFSESALVNRIEVYGDLAQAWSSYEGRYTNSDGTRGAVRGINSFQLVRQQDGRWLVQSILWQAETPQIPLPTDMIGAR